MLPDARDVARMIALPALLRHMGWRVRHRNRADCGLCRGNSTGTVAFTKRLWRCHRCNEGGDVFSLVRAANCCGFPEALRYVAELAGIHPKDSRGADFRRQLATRKRQRERIEAAAAKLANLERRLRLRCRDRIHDAERKRLKASERLSQLQRGEPEAFPGEAESLWTVLQDTSDLLRTDLATYTLLAFGVQDIRARFVLHAEKRNEIVNAILIDGFVRAEDSKLIEVLE